MQVREGDFIGTKDGRFGIVSFVATQQRFLVTESVDPLEPVPEAPSEFWTSIANVASIV